MEGVTSANIPVPKQLFLHLRTIFFFFLAQTIPVTLQCSVIMLHCHMLYFIVTAASSKGAGFSHTGITARMHSSVHVS